MALLLSIAGVVVMLYCLVSLGFFTYVSIKPDAPNKDKKLRYGIYSMSAISFVMALLCLYFINFTCASNYKRLD